MHEANSFVTLTYNDQHLPQYGSLRYRDFQLFMKRLRKKMRVPVRFFMCGEYGENFARPHYHALLFGCRFDDAVRAVSVYSKRPVYRSAALEALWPLGHSSIGEVNATTAAYTASYSLKKVTGDLAKDHYTRVVPETGELVELVPEFARMSLGRSKGQGIGGPWLAKYGPDVWNWDNVVLGGKIMPVPKYYDKIIAEKNPIRAEEIEFERAIKSQDSRSDNTPERLAVKEKVAAARADFYSRKTL